MPNGKIFIPPGGFAGFSGQTQATQALLRPAASVRKGATKKRATKKRKRTARKKTARVRARTKPRTKQRGKLVKGSAAAKRRMAQLRKMRKR